MLDQLSLGIRLLDGANFKNFLEGYNQEAVCALKQLLTGINGGFIYLWGERDVGKSHLLQASYEYANDHHVSPFYLSLSEELSPKVLENLTHFSLICIDNIDVIVGKRDWEEGLFHFYNNCQQMNLRLLMAGRYPPAQLKMVLPDLKSRLTSGVIYALKPLNDHQKLEALQLRALTRGLILSDEVGNYLLNRYPRDMSTLYQLLEILDRASLKAQRRLTIPFVKVILSKFPV